MTSHNLRPCPFCASHNLQIVLRQLHYSVCCQSCRANGPQGDTVDTALTQWNRQQTAVAGPCPAGDALTLS